MDENEELPASIGARQAEGDDALDPDQDATLVRLYAALRELDGALHNALRELDVTLGRNPTAAPPEALPYKDLKRLRMQVSTATGGTASRAPRRLSEIAPEETEGAAEPSGDDDQG